jgi:hypothetical protein
MYVINRLALVLVLGGALFFGLRDGGKEAVSGNPEALLESNVEHVDAMITGDTQLSVTSSLEDSMGYAEGVSDDITGLAD